MILINPRFNRAEKCSYFSKWVPVTFPLSLVPLAQYLIIKNRTAKIIDENVSPIDKDSLGVYLKNVSPPYIFGITSVTANIMSGYRVAGILKALYPESKVIMGGIHPTVMPEEALNTGNVDIVVRGEGEETLYYLYDRIKKKEPYYDIAGISFFDRNKEPVHNPPARLFPDLNLLTPFPYHIFGENLKRYQLCFIMATRGCPYDCIFCSSRSISGKKYRFIEPEKVIQQLDILVNEYKQRYIYFNDDNLVVNKRWTLALCRLMYEQGYYKKVKFSCSLRGDIADDEIMCNLKKAGFVLLNYGVENVHNRLLKILKKGETIEEITKAVVLTKKYGMRSGGTFILGLPTETAKERLTNFTWAKKYLDFARFNNPSPYPGTELYEIAKKENRLNLGENYLNLNPVGALVEQTALPYVPEGCTEKELRKDIQQFNYKFWFRPKSISLLLFEGSPLWFYLKRRWYLNPLEWVSILKLGARLVFNSLFKLSFVKK